MTLIELVRALHAMGATVQHINNRCWMANNRATTYRVTTRWINIDHGLAVFRINYSALPHQPRWQFSAHWGFGTGLREHRELSGPDLVAEFAAVLAEILAGPATLAEWRAQQEPMLPVGQLDLFAELVTA